jgi:predicted DsbA family dithiol-disulfide isomerase
MSALEITFVSDIVCPWCAIGLHTLERALLRFPGLQVSRRVMPFELNPGLSAEGEELVPYLRRKYGMTTEQVLANQEAIRQRGAEVGFEFRMDLRTRTYNTRAAHRLLAWAGTTAVPEAQWKLKKQLLAAYFTQGENPGDTDVLVATAQAVGLDPEAAAAVLGVHAFDDEVVRDERQAHAWGIQGVPATILNGKYLVSGGQPVEVFVQAVEQATA